MSTVLPNVLPNNQQASSATMKQDKKKKPSKESPLPDIISAIVNNPIIKGAVDATGKSLSDMSKSFTNPAKQLASTANAAVGGQQNAYPVTAQDEADATQGAVDFFGGASMAPYIEQAAPFVKPAVGQSKAVADDAINGAKTAVKETVENTKAQPGGFQAGFARIKAEPTYPKPDYEGNNTWSPFIKNEKTGNIIKNPHYKSNGDGPPTKTVQNYPDAPTAEFSQSGAGEMPIQKPIVPKEPGKLPHPDVRPEPTDISAARTGKHPLTGGNPVRVDLRGEANKNPYYLDDMNKSQEVLDKYVPGNTAIEVENNLPKALKEESKRIENVIGDDPNSVQVSDIIAQNEANMREKGISAGLAKRKGKTPTESLIMDLREQLGHSSDDVVPSAANGRELIKYKKALDDRLQSVYKKIDNGTTLTAEENAMLTMRRTINEVLKSENMYPEIGPALDRQSAMIDARPSVAKAAGAEEGGATKAAIEAANTPKPGVLDKVKNTVNNPLVKYSLTAAGAGEIVRGGQDLSGALTIAGEAGSDLINGLPNILGGNGIPNGVQNNKPENEGQHGQTISYQFPEVKPNADGSWTLDQKQQPGGSFMTQAQFKQATANLVPNDPTYQKIMQQYNDSKQNANNIMGRKGGKVYDFMNDAVPSFTGVSTALKSVDSLPTGFWNAWKPGLNIKSYASDPNNDANYAKAMINLTKINDKFSSLYSDMEGKGIDPEDNTMLIQPGNSANQIKIKLDAMANYIKGYYKQGGDYPGQYEDAYLATTSPTGTSNQAANQAAINSIPTTSDGGNVGFTHQDAGSYLPNIVGR